MDTPVWTAIYSPWVFASLGSLLAYISVRSEWNSRLRRPSRLRAQLPALSAVALLVCFSISFAFGLGLSEAAGAVTPWVYRQLTYTASWWENAVTWSGLASLLATTACLEMLSRQWVRQQPGASRKTLLVLSSLLVCSTLGATFVGQANAVPTGVHKITGNVFAFAGEGAELVNIAFDWNANSEGVAYLDIPFTIMVEVEGAPSTSIPFVVFGDGILMNTPLSDRTDTPVERGQVGDFQYGEMTPSGCEVMNASVSALDSLFEEFRGIRGSVETDEAGRGQAILWFETSKPLNVIYGARSSVVLPALNVEAFPNASCALGTGILAGIWTPPQNYGLDVAVGADQLDPEAIIISAQPRASYADPPSDADLRWHEVGSPTTDDGIKLYAEYEISTLGTTSHAQTQIFLAALMWGLALQALFELVRQWPVRISTVEMRSIAMSPNQHLRRRERKLRGSRR